MANADQPPAANEKYVQGFGDNVSPTGVLEPSFTKRGSVGVAPTPSREELTIIACMDARIRLRSSEATTPARPA